MNKRLKITLQGLLQGIGFRPFVYRLAVQYQQTGWVANNNTHVVIEIEGNPKQQSLFLADLQSQVPGGGHISAIQQQNIALLHEPFFQIKTSLNSDGTESSVVCPDLAVCKNCLTELFDPHNRRYLHPFISCCQCGPRYSLMYELPYDRCNISLRDFALCPHCVVEYQNPSDRRFHAQTIACHECGPQLSFYDHQGQLLQQKHTALEAAISALTEGKIVAVKSVGGFQLLVDAGNQAAILRLRERKHRPGKPFALMASSLTQAHSLAELNAQQQQLLTSPAAPIVLVRAKMNSLIAPAVAPSQALLGIMLPYTPLHHLILHAMSYPVVATSANQHDEPICIDNMQAFTKLSNIADFFLCHDRAILRPLDDSIVRIIGDKPTLLRRARGYVPTPILLPEKVPESLAVGGHLKNTVALARDRQVILSQHLGDLTHLETSQQFERTITDLTQFFRIQPQQVVCDVHPDYVSSHYAQCLTLPKQTVQHHYAHILSCMAEHRLKPPALGIAWDGTGLGTDNQLWGGEFLYITSPDLMTGSPLRTASHSFGTQQGFQRIASLRPFALIGGTQAIKEPRRVALALLYDCFGEDLFTENYAHLLTAFSQNELKLLGGMLKKSLHCPKTSSIGRLFDGVASLLGLCQISEFEGQAAMALEQVAMLEQCEKTYLMTASPQRTGSHSDTLDNKNLNQPCIEIDWQPLLLEIVADLSKLTKAKIAAKFHQTLAKLIFEVIEHEALNFLKLENKSLPIVLSGGCFQNACLVNAIENLNRTYQFPLFFHQQVPPNDGGLALGQIYVQIVQSAD